jgi:hypothetical protein
MIIDSPIISGSYSASGSLNQFGNVVISGSLTVTGSIIGTASFASTASYLSGYVSPFPFTGSAIISGSLDVTGSLKVTGSITSTGTLTAQTLIVQTITSSVVYSSGSNVFGNDLANTQVLTGSVTITGSLAVNGSNAILTNQTSSMSASYAVSASYALNSTSASFATTSSFSLNVPVTASFANTATSASYALTSSFSLNVPVTASFANNATSASFATTASYLTGYISPFPFTGSAIVSGSLTVTGSAAVSNLQGTGVRYLVADSSGSITAQTASAALKSTQAFTSTAGQTTFSVTNGYSTGYVDVFINGSKLATAEFTDTSGTNIVLATGSFSGDTVEVVKYTPAAGVTNNVLRQLTTFTASAGQTIFSASYTPGLLDIFYNGSRLSPSDYTANNGTFFTLATGSAANDILDVLVYSYQVGAFSGIGGVGTADQIAYFGTTNSITGSPNFTISGSTMLITGSLIVSGSGTFTNIGPAVFSGSLTSTAGFTGSFSGTATSASYAANAELLDGLDSTVFTLTSSFAAQTASFTAFTASVNSFTASQLVLNGKYATTGSNTFAGIQTINSNLVVTGSITAQTLVVQTITSSVDFVTGSTRFGSSLSTSTHQFTGSVSMTGSLAVVTNGTEFQVTAAGVNFGNVIGDTHNITGSIGISGSLSGTSATFSGGATFFNGGNTFIFSQNVLTSGNADGAHIRNVISTAANPTYAWSGDTDTGMYSDTANTIGFSTSGLNRMYINSSGNVGIGTASPVTADGSSRTLQLLNTVILQNVVGSQALFSNNAYYDGTWKRATALGAAAVRMNTDSGQTGISFHVGPTGTAGSSITNWDTTDIKMRINENGNVGIGSMTPGSKLYVVGTSGDVTSDTGNGTIIEIYGGNITSTNNGIGIGFTREGSQLGYIKAARENTSNEASFMIFSTQTSAGAHPERMRITSGGQTNFKHSTNDLDVVTLQNQSSSPYGMNITYTAVSPNNGSNNFLYLADSTTLRFAARSNGGLSNYSGNNVNLASDIRLKKDIVSLSSEWDKLKQIEVVNFRYKDSNEETTLYGAIAQQVQEVYPNLVIVTREATETEPEYYGLREQPFQWLTTKVLQEAMAKIEEQQTLITALQEKLERNNIN